MGPDVALGQRAIERVGERMQRHVGVRMTLERRGMGDANAAQPYMVAGGKSMDVETLTDPHLARSPQ